jgi:surface protein
MANIFITKEKLKTAVDLWCNNRSAALAQYGNISDWDVSNVTDMSKLFKNCVTFNDDIGRWDVSKVTDMTAMFFGAEAFNQPIGRWNVSTVNSMNEMFFGAEAFNKPIGDWNVSNVNNMNEMFSVAHAFNQPIGNWDVSKVTDMTAMFSGAATFNQPIGNWNVSNVKNMDGMFSGAQAFNQPIGKWNVSNVTDMDNMFYEARSFNQPITDWDLSNVTNMDGIFTDADAMQPSNAPPIMEDVFEHEDATPPPKAMDYYNNIAATPLEESAATFKNNAKAYESIITAEDIKIVKYLNENIRNIVFKVGGANYACTKDDIENYCINSDRSIIFGCKEVDTALVPRAENVIRDIPYINPLSFGITVGLFRLSDIKTVLNDPTIRCIEVGDYPTENGVRALNPVPVKELVTVTSLSMLGQDPNALGALHCQAGQKMYVYSLRKMALPTVPVPDMGVSKQRRMTKRKHSINGKHSLKEKRSQKSKRSRKGIRTLNGGAKRTRRA